MTVYFVQDGGPDGHIKIGYTRGLPRRRVAELQTGNPRLLVLLVAIEDSVATERDLHARFKSSRVAGEWFRPDKVLLDFVATMRLSYPLEETAELNAEEHPSELIGCHPRQARALRGFLDATRIRERLLCCKGPKGSGGGSELTFIEEINALALLDEIDTMSLFAHRDQEYEAGVAQVMDQRLIDQARDRVEQWIQYHKRMCRLAARERAWSPDVLELIKYNDAIPF